MSDDSSRTYEASSQLSDLVLLQGASGPKRHANLHFRKISNAVKGGHAKCYNCEFPARSVSVIQIENPDGLLIHAVCNDCLDKQDEAVQQMKNDFNAVAVAPGPNGTYRVTGLGGHKVLFPSERVSRSQTVDDAEIIVEEEDPS